MEKTGIGVEGRPEPSPSRGLKYRPVDVPHMPFGIPPELLAVGVLGASLVYAFRDEIIDEWPIYAGAAILGFVIGWKVGIPI